jgi:hypothetical protein
VKRGGNQEEVVQEEHDCARRRNRAPRAQAPTREASSEKEPRDQRQEARKKAPMTPGEGVTEPMIPERVRKVPKIEAEGQDDQGSSRA